MKKRKYYYYASREVIILLIHGTDTNRFRAWTHNTSYRRKKKKKFKQKAFPAKRK